MHIYSHLRADNKNTNEICKHKRFVESDSFEKNIQCLHLLWDNEFRIPASSSCQHTVHALGHTQLNDLGHCELSKGLTLNINA